MNKNIYLILPLLFFFACQNDNPERVNSTQKNPSTSSLFQLLSPEQTNINFVNQLDEGLNTNVLMYEYFYNGGGVAAADFNNDGLVDIYFTSNMSDNKLYLNKGEMQFEDITQRAGASGRPGPWKTGISAADVNGDGLIDLYLCYSGALPELKRANQLFINTGNNADGVPTFKEEAAQYSLDSKAFSNQAYFFDYDKDADLDMLLLNHNPKSLPVLNEVSTAKALEIDDPFRGVRLFQQDNGKFKDITQKVGLSGSALTYGLGIGIADVNNDGWPDFYISNDYTIPDYLYINNQNGTFTDKLQESLRHNSHFSMGNDIADMNNDGWQDIITLDMLPEDNHRQKLLMAPDNYSKFDLNLRSGFHYQYMRNMLQLNNGNGTFSEIGQLAGISNTDWSWAALAADYDNDGWKDLYITNGYHRDYTNLDFIKYMDDFVQTKGRLQREDVLELIKNMPASDVVNYMFANRDGLSFTNTTKKWGLHQIANSNGAAYADLDNDGDLDLIVNNINKPAFIYENKNQKSNNYLQIQLKGEGKNTQGLGTKVAIFYNGKKQILEQFTARGYLSSVAATLHFGLGKVEKLDSLITLWPSGKQEKLFDIKTNQRLVLEEKNAKNGMPFHVFTNSSKSNIEPIFTKVPSPIPFQHNSQNVRDFDRQPLLINELSHQGPIMEKGDLNGDGLEDIFIGGSRGQAASVYFQQKNGTFTLANIPDFETDKDSEDAAAALFDANGDGVLDIYVASGGYHDFTDESPQLQDRLYWNDGKGNFNKNPNALPKNYESNAALTVHDVNGDGHLDLFVGARVVPGRYPETPRNSLLINNGDGTFSNEIQNLAPNLQKMGMVTDAEWMDLNNDNQKELIVVGEWMPISVFSITDGKLSNTTAQFFDKSYKGWWNTLKIADFNNDQKPDLLIGNTGLNTQFQVSENEPAELFYKDFDRNGSVDPLFCFYLQGKSYPYLTRDEMLSQIVPLRSRFTNYKSYADASLNDIFTKKELEDVQRLEANMMETCLFLSTAEGGLRKTDLPIQVQYAPVYAIHTLDFDGDGNLDVLLGGNNSRIKLRLGQMDGSYGILLRGDGKGGFKYFNQLASGLEVTGDVRCILEIGKNLIFGVSNSHLKNYKKQSVH